jgi:hypothetical protein
MEDLDGAMIAMTVNELFEKYDLDKNGEIDKEEARDLFAELFAMTFGTSVVETYGADAENTF